MLTQARQQLLTLWQRQSPVQRWVLAVLLLAILILAPVFLTWANTPTYGVAFSGLSEADAGQIVEKLTEEGVDYRLRNSDTILVPSNQVYEIRLRMAREGLPQGGNVGYELFNGSTLGMTEFTQRINYQRALEGELERTIGSLEAVSAVRVHIVTPEKSLFSGEQAPTTASITVKEKPGNHLNAAQVKSITHLVASSVEGMKPENVVVVDVNGTMLASGVEDANGELAASSDNHRAAELAAAAEMQKKVQELLDSALGPNRSVVQATVAMDWTQREITKQSYTPDEAVVRSSAVISETYLAPGGANGGIPGAVTNLPPAVSPTLTADQAVEYRRNEETTNYEISQVETREVQAPGQITRVSLSVLVDGVQDPAQLSSLEAVIAAAAGIDKTRGDTLAVQTLAFDRSFYETQAADLEGSQREDLYWMLGKAGAVALLLIALLWYIQRLLSNLRLASSEAWTPVLKTAGPAGLQTPAERLSLEPNLMMPTPANLAAALASQPAAAPLSIPEPQVQIPALSAEDEQIQKLVVRLAEDNPATVADIIQMWLNEDEK